MSTTPQTLGENHGRPNNVRLRCCATNILTFVFFKKLYKEMVVIRNICAIFFGKNPNAMS
jgi:hypothetical protein